MVKKEEFDVKPEVPPQEQEQEQEGEREPEPETAQGVKRKHEDTE